MPSISQLGTINVNSLIVADVYVQLIPPAFRLNGIPSSIFGAVGTASWGPVNSPVPVSDYAQYAAVFGPMMPRQYDMGTAAFIAFQQGPAAIGKFVRITDGTDTAASVTIQTNCMTATSKYTGTLGNLTQLVIDAGSAANTNRARIIMPGGVPEIYDNIYKGVASVAVTTGGTGYNTTVPTLTFSDPQIPGGRRASGHLVAASGVITSVVIDDPGNGYTTAPTATIAGGSGTGCALGLVTISAWPAIADAINNGQGGLRGPSNFIVATPGVGTTTPTNTTYTLAGGTDGAAGISGTQMLGQDSLPRTGMYALRGQGCSTMMLCELTDTSTWATQLSFAVSEGIFVALVGPSGQSIASAVTAKTTAAIDSYAAKVLLGDWIYFNDTVNALPRRLISPQAFWVGRRANLSPEQSTLNKQVYGVVASQQSIIGRPYSVADLTTLATAGIDVLCTPSPGGGYFGFRNGRNTSSNGSIHGENYTTMTNYIAQTLAAGMGYYIGALQSRRKDDRTRGQAKATLDAFLAGMKNTQPDPMIDDFLVVLDKSNNADDTIGRGYMFGYAKVVFMSIVEFFVINLEGGQTVQISRQSQQPF